MRQCGLVVVADTVDRDRASLTDVLTRGGYSVLEVASGAEALEAARRPDVRLVALEVTLTDMTGYEVCQELRREHGDARAIFFVSGTRTEPLDRAAGLLLGADDFIVKPFDPSELLARVHRFVERASAPTTVPVPERNGAPHLTEREHEVLARVAAGDGQKQIAKDLSISVKTVSTHIQHLYTKLGVHSRAELVSYAYRAGFVAVQASQVGALIATEL